MVNGPRRPRGNYSLNIRHYGYSVKHWRLSIQYRRKAHRFFALLAILEEEEQMPDISNARIQEIGEEKEILTYLAFKYMNRYNIIRGIVTTVMPNFRLLRPAAVLQRGSYWTHEDFADHELYHNCRLVSRESFNQLKQELRLPDILRADNNCTYTGEELLLMYLYHRTFPRRLYDTQLVFGLEYSQVSRGLKTFKEFIDQNWSHKVTNSLALFAPFFESYHQAVQDKILAINGNVAIDRWSEVCCFLDGTLRQHNRDEQNNYSGHKKITAFRWLNLTAPDGMIMLALGPTCGRHNDHFVQNSYAISNMIENSQQPRLLANPNAALLVAGTDKGFHEENCVQPMYNRRRNTPAMRAANRICSSIRVSNEHDIGRISNTFKGIDYHRQQFAGLQPLGVDYRVAVFMTNCLNALNHSQTSKYFGLAPMSLEQYLS